MPDPPFRGAVDALMDGGDFSRRLLPRGIIDDIDGSDATHSVQRVADGVW
jgi:hypothetical protein